MVKLTRVGRVFLAVGVVEDRLKHLSGMPVVSMPFGADSIEKTWAV